MPLSDTGLLDGRLEIVRVLGAGSAGIVYEARDRRRQQTVALKSLRRADPEALLALKNEFRSLADVRHPNLVRLDELLEAGGQWLITMELVRGCDLLQWIRPESVFSESRARAALFGLAEGLDALHLRGKVHCDIKPTNVLVTGEGRVVLLDFGLVRDALGAESSDATRGTPAYMPPEMSRGPESDWYAVGVMLYQALTGELPFDGEPRKVLRTKRQQPPPDPDTRAQCPSDLAALCRGLLATDPRERATTADVRACARRSDVGVPLRQSAPRSEPPPFIGRTRELQELDAALAATSGGPVIAVIEGESGVGKSALVEQFAAGVRLGARDVLVLQARCYERETVPFKAFDGVVDMLTRYLQNAGELIAATVRPLHVAALSQAFPVLRAVPGYAPLDERATATRNPQELRNRVHAAFREVLGRLADTHRVVVTIDDLQWADDDSFGLMAELLRSPDAPPVLFVATVRSGAIPRSSLEARLGLRAEAIRSLAVPPLAHDEACALVERLSSGQITLAAEQVAALVREAGGHPLFVDALLRSASRGAAQSAGPLRLDEALCARVRALADHARALVEALAIAGTPLPHAIARAAAGVPGPIYHDQIAELRAAHLLRTARPNGAEGVEIYHDRLREAVATNMTPERKRACHEALVRAFADAACDDPDAVSTHAEGAGDVATARRQAVLAGDRANASLAFAHAAARYRRAIDLGLAEHEGRAAVVERYADALANAGYGREAADAYAEAAQLAPHQAIELRRRGAEQLLLCGEIQRGREALASVMDALGVRVSRSFAAALLCYFTVGLWFRLRGYPCAIKPDDEVDPLALRRTRALHSAVFGLTYVDVSLAIPYLTQLFRAAAVVGDRQASALFYAGWAIVRAYAADASGAARLLERARDVNRELGDAFAEGFIESAAGQLAWIAHDWPEVRRTMERAEREYLRSSLPTRNIAVTRSYQLNAAFWLGDLLTVRRLVPVLLADAKQRRDICAIGSIAFGCAGAFFLQNDAPQALLAEADAFADCWRLDASHQKFAELHSRIDVALYEGAPARAHALMKAHRMAFRIVEIASGPEVGPFFQHLHLRIALACAGASVDVERSTRAARRIARQFERDRRAAVRGIGALARASLACLSGDRLQTEAALERASEELDASSSGLYAMAARYRLGELRGPSSKAACEAAAYFSDQKVVRPDRFVRVLAPGFPEVGT